MMISFEGQTLHLLVCQTFGLCFHLSFNIVLLVRTSPGNFKLCSPGNSADTCLGGDLGSASFAFCFALFWQSTFLVSLSKCSFILLKNMIPIRIFHLCYILGIVCRI